MYNEHKIISVTPAGRKYCLEILTNHLLSLRGTIDEHHFWVNTKSNSDIEYMQTLHATYPNFFKLIYHEKDDTEVYTNLDIHKFFKNYTDKNTVYIRFDDDIIWIDNEEKLQDFIQFRIDNPKYFLIFANTINNGICNYIHQRTGALKTFKECFDPNDYFIKDIGGPGNDWFHNEAMGRSSWNKNYFVPESINENGLFAYNALNYSWFDAEVSKEIHDNFISKIKNHKLDKFRFGLWELSDFERVSINCISWLGSEFEKFNGEVGIDEEKWLSVTKPREIKKINCIYGNFIVSHYGFGHQHEPLTKCGYIDKYANLKYQTVEEIPDFPRCNITSLLEIQTKDQKAYQTKNKKDLKDFTFVIPIQMDSTERLNNFNACIGALNKICDTNILIIEHDKASKIKDLPANCKHIFVEQIDDYFARNKILNLGYKSCETKFAVNFEADCILSPNSLFEAVEALRAGHKFAIPYAYFALFMNQKVSDNFISTFELPLFWKDYFGIEFLSEYGENTKAHWKTFTFHNGLCFLFELEAYKKCGYENEFLVQHGWDDYEHYLRVKRLGYEIYNSSGMCYHLFHTRKVTNNNWYDKNSLSKTEFFRIANLSNKDLKEEVKSWGWTK
jgi:hypothetical protein